MHVSEAASTDRDAVTRIGGTAGLTVDADAELARPGSRLWVARPARGSEPVAFLLAWRVADELQILDVGTDPGCRRRGAARSLLARALADARRWGAKLALLEVRRSNRAARSLYESAGFVPSGSRSGYYADGEDALLMRRALEPLPADPGHEVP